ncbi:MAG: BON domain-containing protein [Rhodospirillaceae bacterium]
MSARAFGKMAMGAAALSILLAEGGCVVPVIGLAGTTAVKATEDRGIGGAVTDLKIQAQINDLWLKRDLEMFSRINLSIDQGRVLLTGRAATPEQRMEAVKLCWQADGVTEVINEIVVDNESVMGDTAHDKWIGAKLRTALLLDKDIHNTNYNIDVVNDIVYLLGVAHSQDELDRVIGHAKAIAYVQGVVSHVRVVAK